MIQLDVTLQYDNAKISKESKLSVFAMVYNFKLLIYADGYVAETVRFQIASQLYRLRYMFEHILCIHSLYNVLLY